MIGLTVDSKEHEVTPAHLLPGGWPHASQFWFVYKSSAGNDQDPGCAQGATVVVELWTISSLHYDH